MAYLPSRMSWSVCWSGNPQPVKTGEILECVKRTMAGSMSTAHPWLGMPDTTTATRTRSLRHGTAATLGSAHVCVLRCGAKYTCCTSGIDSQTRTLHKGLQVQLEGSCMRSNMHAFCITPHRHTTGVLEAKVDQHLGVHNANHTHAAAIVNDVCCAQLVEERRVWMQVSAETT